jgi:hypothetical protein
MERSACLDVGSIEMTVLGIGDVPSNMFSTLLITEATKLLVIGNRAKFSSASRDCHGSHDIGRL